MKLFLDGAMMMSFILAGLFFLKFWLRTRDRLFFLFAIAFFIMGINRVFLSFSPSAGSDSDESQTIVYMIRLTAYVIILLAIVDKNRTLTRAQSAGSVYRD